MTVHEIHTLDLPGLEPYRTLREKTQHWQRGVFIAEGDKVVYQLIESDVPVLSMLLSPEWFVKLEAALLQERFEDTDVYIAEPQLLTSIVGYQLHKNLMALGAIPPSPALEDLRAGAHSTNIHAAVESIADAENMGMIIRNCAAFGVDTLVVGGDSASPWLRRSVRVSVGTVFHLRILTVDNLLRTLYTLRAMHGWQIVATVPRGGDTALPVASQAAPLCLLFGSEAHGLSDSALALCDARFTIPMRGGVDSLNVSNTVAVALYEAGRGKHDLEDMSR